VIDYIANVIVIDD